MIARAMALQGIAEAGADVVPIDAIDAGETVLILLRVDDDVTPNQVEWLRRNWHEAVENTPLADVKTAILQKSIGVEFVKR